MHLIPVIQTYIGRTFESTSSVLVKFLRLLYKTNVKSAMCVQECMVPAAENQKKSQI